MADHRNDSPGKNKRRSRIALLLLLGLIVVVAAAALLGWLPRREREKEINQKAKEEKSEIPRVQAVRVTRSPSASELMIPGTTIAYTEAYIYARANGYLAKRLVDIGDKVQAGQLMAVITAPDLDQQVSQARSALSQSESNLNQLQAQLHLASLTWERWKVLVAKGVFSRQDGDTQEANYRVAEANVRASENTVQGNRANLDRLVVLQQYENVRAPFAGVVTARNVDVGALITAQGTGLGSSSESQGGTQMPAQSNSGGTAGASTTAASPSTGGSQGGEMFRVAQMNPLRVLVSVPESYASAIRVGQKATLHVEADPKAEPVARVSRTSASVDQNTRTLLVELRLDNSRGRYLPGTYVTVSFVDARSQHPIVIPGNAIVVRDAKTVVAKIQNNTVHFQPIEIGRDYGNESEISNGLAPGDVIAVDVTDEVHDGAKIEPQFKQEQQQNAGGGQSDKKPSGATQYGEQALSNQTGQSGKNMSSGGKSKSGNQNGAKDQK